MESEPKQLKWDELAHTEGQIPWQVLEDFIEALIQTPSVWEEIARRYDAITIIQDYNGYEELYIPYIFAKAAPKLNSENKIKIIPFLLEKLSEAGQDDNDYMLEAFNAACGRMGPVILPFVLKAIEKEEDTFGAWVFLWSLLKLAADEKNPGAKQNVIDYCVERLNKALRNELDVSETEMAAELLANLGCREYAPLVKKLVKKSAKTDYYQEYRQSFQILNGEIPPFDIKEMWEGPLEGWLEGSHKAFHKWYQQRDAQTLDEEDSM